MRIFACITVFFCSLAHATQPYDLSGLWMNSKEPGWGVSVHQQGDVLFLTLLVYGEDGEAHWYVAPDVYNDGDPYGYVDAPYYGDLYSARGPVLAWSEHFDSAKVSLRRVGTVSFGAVNGESGTIRYDIDGRQVGRQVTRHTWAAMDIAGSYAGARMGYATGASCVLPLTQRSSQFQVSQAGSAIRIVLDEAGTRCEISGTLSQSGTAGEIAGQMTCPGVNARFTANEVRVNANSLSMRYTIQETCSQFGMMGGIRFDP
jgi:hypothetical protein